MTSTLEYVDVQNEVIAYDENGDQIFTHLGDKAKVTEGYVMGTPVVALCGKVFVPHRDPLKYPVCKECDEIAMGLFARRED
jgi:hypothetical protein